MIKNKKKTSRITSVLSAVTAAVLFSTTVFASGLLSDWAAEDYTVEITKNGENVELLNKPFIEYGSVYVPLRECMEKAGFSEANQNAYINWDNGKIDMAVVQSNGMAGIYTLEIGNYMLGLKRVEPGDIYSAESSVNDLSIAMSITMDSAPILDGAVTYVSVDDMNYMLYMFLEMPDEPRYEYSIFDKAGDDITERFNSERLAAAEAEYMAYPHNTVSYFFSDFEQREFDAMKKYCTQEFIDEFFGDGYVFGMTQAYITDMRIDPMEYAKSSNDFVITVDVNMTPHEQSVYDPSQTSTTFNITLLRQSDGRYLIDEFGR